MLLCTRVPKLHVPAAELWKELVLDVHEASHLSPSINMAGGACKCGAGSLVHRRKFDRSHSDAAVLCAGVSFSWARPAQQPNESWVSRRIW